MAEFIRTKRYVCPVCSGSAKVPVFEVIFGPESNPPEEDKWDDCMGCVGRGLPSFIEIPLNEVEVTVK
jgi:hypothetical protein